MYFISIEQYIQYTVKMEFIKNTDIVVFENYFNQIWRMQRLKLSYDILCII
jgi:hypothetical protein